MPITNCLFTSYSKFVASHLGPNITVQRMAVPHASKHGGDCYYTVNALCDSEL